MIDELPGIGYTTACAIATYSWNIPTVFIETNVRRVFLHHFFPDQVNVADKDIYPLVEKTVDTKNPRDWYYGLMDYGSYIAKHVPNPNRNSKHYTKQTPFEQSDRKIRGQVIRALLQYDQMKFDTLQNTIIADKPRLKSILERLVKEKIVKRKSDTYRIS